MPTKHLTDLTAPGRLCIQGMTDIFFSSLLPAAISPHYSEQQQGAFCSHYFLAEQNTFWPGWNTI